AGAKGGRSEKPSRYGQPCRAESSLYGVYAKQTGNAEQATSYWMKAAGFSPKHLLALLSLADALLRENHEAEALPYATQAVEAEPAACGEHPTLASVRVGKGSAAEAVQAGERGMELAHDQAAIAQPVLAAALARKGESGPAITTLQAYLLEHPSDDEAK